MEKHASRVAFPRGDSRRDGVGEFEGVRAAWQDLRGNARYFFQTPEWVELLAQRGSGDLAFGALSDGDGPAAVSILRRSLRRIGHVDLSVLSEVRVGDGRGVAFSDALIDHRANVRPRLGDLVNTSGPWHVLQLRGLREHSPWLGMAAGDGHVRGEPDGGVGVLDTDREIGDLWGVVGKNMRNSIRKAQRRLETVGGSDVSVSTGAEAETAYDRFVAMEAAGWKGREGTPLAQTPDLRELLRDYVLASDTAQVRTLTIDGRPAASQITVTVAETLFLLKVTYEEQFADLSPGNILMANLLETCCEDPTVSRIDCIVWQAWHRRWGMLREPTYQLIAFNGRSIRGAIAEAAWRSRRLLLGRRGRGHPAPSHSA